MFVFSKQGQVGLDLEIVSTGDASISTQDLQDHRQELIALSGIPAPLILAAKNNFIFCKFLEFGESLCSTKTTPS